VSSALTPPIARDSAIATASGRVRVLVVDDSVVIRRLLRQVIDEDRELEFVGAAPSGLTALAQIPHLNPDAVTLDIEMPEINGIETLRRIRKQFPKLRTIMFSTLTTRGAAATFEALSAGADDYVAKVSGTSSLDESLATIRSHLIPRLKQFFLRRPAVALRPPDPAKKIMRPCRPRIVAIGVSTGGPQALASIVPQFPASFPLPILIVQHMPPMFTRFLADSLQAGTPLKVQEAAAGAPISPGRILITPGDHHLRVRSVGPSGYITTLDQGPHENSCRPSVDVLFRSLAETYGGDVLSVVLTGMGSDGAKGVEALKAAGACSIVQDEATSVVWGMPGSVARAGLADRILPLDRIVPEIVNLTTVSSIWPR
jgi:two-component system, chemotaxis family, protein-glutamate methylesterase/glutaminase